MKFILAALCLLTQSIQATVLGLPTLNGPLVPLFPEGAKTGLGQFKHPGLWLSHDDLQNMRKNVRAGKEPWASSFKLLSEHPSSSPNYTMLGPHPVISRGSVSNYTSFTKDVIALWQNTLMWYITEDQAHWTRATTILDAWGSNLTNIIGTDTSLLVALEGDLMVNSAEILRWEGNWTEAGARWQGGTGFSNQLYWLFARQSIIIGQSNYGMASIKALLNFAVYLEDVTMYNYALNAYLHDVCGGIPGNFQLGTGQSSESGRDQSHTRSGLGWASLVARTLETQGFNVWSRFNSVLLDASEYAAKFNLNQSVPYDPSFSRCEAVLVNGPWKQAAEFNRGITRTLPGVWDLIYYTYNVALGKKTPWTAQAKKVYDAAGGQNCSQSEGNTVPNYGDLIWAREPGSRR